jgi:dipeptidyl aminopeptidase/acylaminoacyl peptidase
MVTPVGYQQGTRVPAFLYIHGGPTSQSQHEFNTTAQLFAANGYAVVMPNYRGSTGRGEAFTRAIYADWGDSSPWMSSPPSTRRCASASLIPTGS